MVLLWRSAATFAVLLRVPRSPSKLAPRAVATNAPSPHHPAQPGFPSPALRDEGDHDPDIDLITLRRRPKRDDTSSNMSSRVDHEHSESDTHASGCSTSSSTNDPVAPNSPVSPLPELRQTESRASKLQSHLDGLAKAIDDCVTQHPKSASGGFVGDTSKQEDHATRASRFSGKEGVLDPYLVSYLKSLQSGSSKARKDKAQDEEHIQQDLDIDSLQPSDVRATFTNRKMKLHSDKGASDMKPVTHVSGEPAVVPEHLVKAGLQHLNLPISGGKVVIPRTMLVRLIEQTINLSGAAVSGNDVVIERYSPTWHRFARLLRTSDLHKISALKPAETASSNSSQTLTQEVHHTTAEDPLPNTETFALNIPKPDSGHGPLHKTPQFTEREYAVLALDSKKKRVVVTRFRRLLDGSSNISPPSSESFLKVASLDRYIPILNHDPETRGIYHF